MSKNSTEQTPKKRSKMIRLSLIVLITFALGYAVSIPISLFLKHRASQDNRDAMKLEREERDEKEKITRVTEVIHILNYHFVTPEVFATDLNEQDNTLTQEQIDKQYAEFLESVEEIQKQQVALLRDLIKKHNLKAVYLEGVTENNRIDVMQTIGQLINEEKREKDPDDPIEQLLKSMNKTDLLQLGAAGQLVLKGELETLLPAEDSHAFENANPVRDDGKIVFNEKADEKREDAIAKNLLRGNGVVVIVLGGNHDLSDNLKRFTTGVKYTRVAVTKYKEVMAD